MLSIRTVGRGLH